MSEERDALCAALVQEYAAILARKPPWDWHYEGSLNVACKALLRVAERLGVTDLHEQAADVVARTKEGEGAP